MLDKIGPNFYLSSNQTMRLTRKCFLLLNAYTEVFDWNINDLIVTKVLEKYQTSLQ